MTEKEKFYMAIGSAEPNGDALNELFVELNTLSIPNWLAILVAQRLTQDIFDMKSNDANKAIGGKGFTEFAEKYWPTMKEWDIEDARELAKEGKLPEGVLNE